MHQSDKKDSEWYSKLLKKNLHRTQVKRHVNSSYSKFNSEESYKEIKLSSTEKKSPQDKFQVTHSEGSTILVTAVKRTFCKKNYKKLETWSK